MDTKLYGNGYIKYVRLRWFFNKFKRTFWYYKKIWKINQDKILAVSSLGCMKQEKEKKGKKVCVLIKEGGD